MSLETFQYAPQNSLHFTGYQLRDHLNQRQEERFQFADHMRPVSYTHLDVYKRQGSGSALSKLCSSLSGLSISQGIRVQSPTIPTGAARAQLQDIYREQLDIVIWAEPSIHNIEKPKQNLKRK